MHRVIFKKIKLGQEKNISLTFKKKRRFKKDNVNQDFLTVFAKASDNGRA